MTDGTYMYFTVGNGRFNASTGDYGMAVMKMDQNLQVNDYFVTSDFLQLSNNDEDTGNVGPVLLPGSAVLFGKVI